MARQKNFQNGAQGEAGTAAIDKLLPPPASRLQAEQRWVALALPHHLGLRPGAVDDCAALCQPRPNIHDKVQTSGPEAVHEHRCVGAKAAGVVVPRAARRAAQQRAVELLQDGLGHCAARVGKESRKGWVGRWPGRREEGAQGFVEDAGRQPQHSRLRCAAPLSFHRQKDIRHRTRTYFTCHTPSKERTQKLATGRPGGGGGGPQPGSSGRRTPTSCRFLLLPLSTLVSAFGSSLEASRMKVYCSAGWPGISTPAKASTASNLKAR